MLSVNTKESHSHDPHYTKPKYELADILKRYLGYYLLSHKLSTLQHHIVEAILKCRTEKLGGHKFKCDRCGYERIEYNSCRNRHCPKCQGSRKIKWVYKRLSELLPIPYYHAVFTMPHLLNTLALYNKAIIYDIFFKACSQTLNAFARDPRFLGAKLGFIGILHTWGQSLCQHIHIHFIVSGGGISIDGTRWLMLPYNKRFLFPSKAMSKHVRKIFSKLLLKAYKKGKLVFPDELSHLKQEENFEQFLNKIAWEKWYNFVKKPFAGPEEVVEYIGRYTHRVAISNHRIINIDNNQVTFHYKKYKDNEVTDEIMSLPAHEFIRRFLLHTLPLRFKKIRHFGSLSNGLRNKYLQQARELLNVLAEEVERLQTLMDELTEKLRKCPECGIGNLIIQKILSPLKLAPG